MLRRAAPVRCVTSVAGGGGWRKRIGLVRYERSELLRRAVTHQFGVRCEYIPVLKPLHVKA